MSHSGYSDDTCKVCGKKLIRNHKHDLCTKHEALYDSQGDWSLTQVAEEEALLMLQCRKAAKVQILQTPQYIV